MNSTPRRRFVMTGMLAGALLGGAFAWLASSRSQESDETALQGLGPSDYFQLGIGILTLARQFQAMLQKSQET